jgi:hypothetical protein
MAFVRVPDHLRQSVLGHASRARRLLIRLPLSTLVPPLLRGDVIDNQIGVDDREPENIHPDFDVPSRDSQAPLTQLSSPAW